MVSSEHASFTAALPVPEPLTEEAPNEVSVPSTVGEVAVSECPLEQEPNTAMQTRPRTRTPRMHEREPVVVSMNVQAYGLKEPIAQLYHRAYLRCIDATKRRPDGRAARITEVVELLAAGTKERSRK